MKMLILIASVFGAVSTVTAATATAATVPAEIAVPTGNKAAMTLVGAGDLTYECKAKPDGTGHEWTFAGPNAVLTDAKKKTVGKYYAGPTWEHSDGSKVTGKQLAVSPNPNAIPLQLVQANPAEGKGMMVGVTYIQRLNTQGGTPPKDPCAANNMGAKQTVKYQADYVFFKKN